MTCIAGAVAGARASAEAPLAYDGQFCSGAGDAGYLRMIDQSFQFFHPNPYRQNISMLYLGKEERLVENMSWYMWWIQNSYGPTFCALPFLQAPWLQALQNAQDLWFKFQGDGKTVGLLEGLVAPDGSLCDCAGPKGAIYVQGDLNWKIHDWFYEAAAAGVIMQGELLLISRDKRAIKRYLPNLERACEFIEKRRDPKNNLFLVGPAANLLAPSYGGIRQPDGSFGKGYLAGLSVSYAAAASRMVQLEKLMGRRKEQALYERRLEITRESLALLQANGCFVKSVAPDGTLHGKPGQQRYGYFEIAPNVDAVCHRVVDDSSASRILARIRSIPELRPHGMLITNYPSLDDTYSHWDDPDGAEKDELLKFGRWVNGGVWSTMEARAIMANSRMERYDDVLKPAKATYGFAQQFQLDAPLKDFGARVWFDANPTNLCYDALGVPAAIARGLFEYVYSADSLTLYPHIPRAVTRLTQKAPIRFGDKRIYITVNNAGPNIQSATVNGRKITTSKDHVELAYDDLPVTANVEIVRAGRWPAHAPRLDTGFVPVDPRVPGELPEYPVDLQKKHDALSAMEEAVKEAPYERQFVKEALAAFESWRQRAALQASHLCGNLSPEQDSAIMAWYHASATNAYDGFDLMMRRYASDTDVTKRRMGEKWTKLNGEAP